MVDAKEAVKRAIAYLQGLNAPATVNDLELEEVEKSDDGKYWLITLSYSGVPGGLASLTGEPRELKSKQFKIRVQTGEVLSMKIRQVHVA